MNKRWKTWIWYLWPLGLVAGILVLKYGADGEVSSTAGQKLYELHCQTCHMADGRGLGKLIPPLAGADYLLKGGPELACVLRYGQIDTILVNGVEYNRPMPPNKRLQPVEIRSILLYIRSAWGNEAPDLAFEDIRAALESCDTTSLTLP